MFGTWEKLTTGFTMVILYHLLLFAQDNRVFHVEQLLSPFLEVRRVGHAFHILEMAFVGVTAAPLRHACLARGLEMGYHVLWQVLLGKRRELHVIVRWRYELMASNVVRVL